MDVIERIARNLAMLDWGVDRWDELYTPEHYLYTVRAEAAYRIAFAHIAEITPGMMENAMEATDIDEAEMRIAFTAMLAEKELK